MTSVDEGTIVGFLTGALTAERLESEVSRSVERVSPIYERVLVKEAAQPLMVTPEMILRLCDAAAAGELSPASVQAVAFMMIASDQMEWSSNLVAEILHDWSAAEINDPITEVSLTRARRWILGEEEYPGRR